jgi:hypothetical protein
MLWAGRGVSGGVLVGQGAGEPSQNFWVKIGRLVGVRVGGGRLTFGARHE